MNGFYKFAMTVMRLVMPLWYKIDADGMEYLPEEGGYLFVSNHRSMADPILIGVQNPKTQFCFLAKQELFSDGFVGWLLKNLGAVAIDRGTGDTNPLEEIEFRLQNGENALIFPEGTRSKDGTLGKFKTGAALIAAQTGVPIVPVGIFFDDDELHFRSTIHIRYGQPFQIPQTDPKNPSPAVLKQVRQEMTKNVSALLTMDPYGEPALEMKHTANSDAEKTEKTKTKKSAEENLKSEVTETKMSKQNQNEKNHKEKPEEEKDILKDIEDEIDEIEEDVKDVREKAEETAENVKEAGKKAVKETSDAIDELDEKEEKEAKKAASAMKTSDSFKKRIKDTEKEIEEKFDEDDLFDDDDEKSKKKKKEKAEETVDDAEEKFFEEEDFDEDFDFDEKPGLFSGLSLKNPFKKKKKDSFDDFDDDFDDDLDEDNPDNAYEEEEYDDDDYDDEEVVGRRIDYGKIALILTFVILGIFAIDFIIRLWNDYKQTKGLLDLQNQSSKVESMVDSSAETDEAPTSETSYIETLETEETTTLQQETAASTTTTTAVTVDNRDTQTIEVTNDSLHNGSLVLVDGTHQMVAAPALVTFASFGPQHLRLVSTEMTVDSSLATPITNWFNDFFAATGLGNVMVYSTTGTPGYPPYSVAIPERSTGLTMDLAILNEAAASHSPYTPDGNYAWLTEHAADYGFIVRYPAGKEDKTGMDAMTWHFRYVGAPHAKYMYDNDLCLEEYLEEIKKHTVSTDHLETTVNGVNYEMFYVASADTGTTTEIKYPMTPDGSTPIISGDNNGGFIVAVVKQ